jgi:biopolymer transport protein ExbD
VTFGREKDTSELRLNLSPMIDVTFLILIYFIVSMQMEPSLDNIIKLPPVLRASRQEDALLQIYILPAKVKKDGSVVRDSTGLIAFSDKAKTPQECELGHPIMDENGNYIPGALVDAQGRPVQDLQKAKARAFKEDAPPPIFKCAQPHGEVPDRMREASREIGPYVKLHQVPALLRDKKEEVLTIMARNRAMRRKVEPTEANLVKIEKELEDSIALMIKADQNTFYGRILQVVNIAKTDTLSSIKNFAFVTLPEASQEVQKKLAEQRGEE